MTCEDRVAQDLDAAQSRLQAFYPSTLRLVAEHSYPYSRIRVVSVDQGHKRSSLFIKRVLGRPQQVHSRIVEEGALLTRLSKVMPGEVSPLVATFPEHMVIVTEECDGTQFDHMICGSRLALLSASHRDRLARAAASCGSWLARFHAETRVDDEEIDGWLKHLDGEVEWRVVQLRRLDVANAKLYQDCCQKFQEELTRTTPQDRVSRLHGDFAPHNIFVSESGHIQVLDFYASRVGHPLADIVNFLGKVATFAETFTFPQRVALMICRGFLHGCQRNFALDRDLLRLLLVLHAVSRTLVIATAPKRPFFSERERRRHVAYITAYLNEVQPTTEVRTPWSCLDPIPLPPL